MTMEFGANFNSGDISPAVWARRREDEGWGVLGCADHFFSMRRGAYPHLWVTLATFAAVTTRVGLSSSFANNLLRSPVEFAQASLEMQIVRQIFDGGACRFDGRYYHVDLPKLRPQGDDPPPLVGSLGGPRTIREVGPLVDRIEVNVSSVATRGGALDLDLLARVERTELDALVRGVRAVNPTAPLGMLVLCNVGDDERTRAYEEQMRGSFLGGFFGPPEKVADALRELEELGLSRVQITPFFESSFELLAPYLEGS